MYFMICSLTFMTWAKKAMKIKTYQETKILFCHHNMSHHGSSVACVRMWGVCLLDLSHSLRIDFIKRFCWDGVFYLIWFSVPTFFFISMQCFGCTKTGSLTGSLNHWIDFCVIVLLEWYVLTLPLFQSSIEFKWDTGSE